MRGILKATQSSGMQCHRERAQQLTPFEQNACESANAGFYITFFLPEYVKRGVECGLCGPKLNQP